MNKQTNILIIIFFILISGNIHSQNYSKEYFINIADSALNKAIGKKYVNYYVIDSTSLIYTDLNKVNFLEVDTIKTFKNIFLKYFLQIPKLQELQSTLFINIDDSLKCSIFDSGVPDFIKRNKNYHGISKRKAKRYALKAFKKNANKIEFTLKQDDKSKKLIWEVHNILSEKTEDNLTITKYEIVKIDTSNGEIIYSGFGNTAVVNK
ncbi:hypothetical protein ACE01N_18325 [Saccharicrinis sp. FJH2]|uniref:hypothetical protein n=1 Tax=Saccharicrinis sp. FJH65 TaxID=3344659 RepID=UPI0035F25FC9